MIKNLNRTLFLIGILFLINTVNAQSKKAVNRHLKNEYHRMKSEYDSVFADYQHRGALLGGTTFRITYLLKEELPGKYAHFEAEKRKVRKSAEDLQKVGLLNFPDFSLERIDTLALDINKMRETFNGIELKGKSGLSVEEKDFAFDSESGSIKSQNELLNKLLMDIRTEIEMIYEVNDRIDTLSLEVTKVKRLAESWMEEIDRMTAFVESYSAPVLAKREEVKMAVQANPKAYGKLYAEVFKDAFLREQVKRTASYEREFPVPEKNKEQEKIIEMVCDVPAEFPGGKSALLAYLSKNLHLPEAVTEHGIIGKCYVRFRVSESGEISGIKILKGIPDCEECNSEAIRVVEGMPNWTPGQNKGKSVSSYFTLPIKFEFKL